jgi:hexosaminidase
MVSLEDVVLLPKPRSVTGGSGALKLSGGRRIVCGGDTGALFPIARRLQDTLRETQRVDWSLGAGAPDSRTGALIRLGPDAGIPEQGYRLAITPERIELAAGDAAGAFYGVMTLVQILRQCEGELPAGEIQDHPDLVSRGVMLDVTRSKVPTMETLFDLVDLFAEMKINHLELYTEHTFAFRDHQEVWAQASPMTGEDILRLDAYCRDRFIELVPNQNSFGHLHRWLELPRYNHLAECPDGFEMSFGDGRTRKMPPFSLNPTDPESLRFLDGLFEELLPHFTSRKFNIGCDETWDLGKGRSARAAAEKGEGRVYLGFLLDIHDLVKKYDRTTHFWGDIIIQHPELVPELPRDAVVLEWGYEADHPFDEHGAKFAGTGIPFYVCPGTSSWNTVAGRTENCLGNVRSAAESGVKHGAVGLLNTDWGDRGHLQYLPVSYLGFAAGAALSWCYERSRDEDFVSALDAHVFRDRAGVMGRLAHDLGNAYKVAGSLPHNSSVLFHLLTWPVSGDAVEGLNAGKLREIADYIRAVIEPLGSARMARPDAATVKEEFANAARMMLHGCERGVAMLEGGTLSSRDDLAADMRTILGEHRKLWTERNRPGGLQEGAGMLEERLKEYAGV